MAEWKVATTDAELDAYIDELRTRPKLPFIVNAEYLRDRDLFILKVSDGRRIAIPREDIQALQNATPDQAADFITEPPGTDIWWPQLDDGLHIDAALEGRYGNDAWMDKVHRRVHVAA